MVAGRQVPCSVVLCIGLDDGEVRGDVEPPRNGPPQKFRLQFRPLLSNSPDVSALVMEEQGRGLDESLDEQDLIFGGGSSLEVVPQVFPCLMCVPEFGLVKQGGARFQQHVLLLGEGVGNAGH